MTDNNYKSFTPKLLHKKISITFLDGKTITCKLIEHSVYELLVLVKGTKEPVIIFKHAIKYIREVPKEKD